MNDTENWLRTHKLDKYVQVFLEHEIEFDDLIELTPDDLRELGLPLGPRKRILKLIAASKSASTSQTSDNTESALKVASLGDAERRHLTLMFCDLVGSTALSTSLDLEQYREIIKRYQNTITQLVQRYEGYIAQFLGDGVLAYFGYPQAHENDAERAVLAALSAIRKIDTVSPIPGLTLEIRIGISTGIVVAGDLIGEGRSEVRSVLGESPNLAARLQTIASPNTAVVSEATQALLADKFDWLDLGSRRIKGFDQAIQPWQLIGKRDPSKLEERGYSTTMFGRERELRTLLDGWYQARNGGGNAILIEAEPGVGKSRLVHELTRRSRTKTVVVLQGSPYYNYSALYPVAEYLSRTLGYQPDDSMSTKLTKLEHYVNELGLDSPAITPLLCPILGIELNSQDHPTTLALTPNELRRRSLEALTDLFVHLSIQSPLLLLAEDLHWVDPTTLELIGKILERIASTRILALITYRPEFKAPWPSTPSLSHLSLSALSEQECRNMLASLAKNTRISEDLITQLIDRTDGVPLYLEELFTTLIEADEEPDAAGIPATLRDALMARLDKLNSVKEAAQLASVIGRRFSIELLSTAYSLKPTALSVSLKGLVDAQIIVPVASDRGSYEFRHALIRDAAYDSILLRKRRQLHSNVADVLAESGYAKTQPEMLGHHYTEAQEYQLAIDHWLLAGQAALIRSANLEAAGHLRRGIALLDFVAADVEREQRELALRTTLGPALIATTGFASDAVGDEYSRARVLCEQFRSSPQVFPAIWGSWVFSLVRGELDSSHALATELLSLGEQTGDSAMLVESHWTIGNSLYWLAQLQQSKVHLERAVEIYDGQKHHENALNYGQDPGVAALCYLSYCHWQLGYPDSAINALGKASELAEIRDHAFTRGWVLAFRFMAHMFRGEPALAQTAAERAIDYCTAQSYPFWFSAATIIRGWGRAHTGELKEGIEEMRNGIGIYQQIGCGVVKPLWFGLLAETLLKNGDTDAASIELEHGFVSANTNKEIISEIDLWRIKGELLASDSIKDYKAAKNAFTYACKKARQQGARSLELRAASSLYRLQTLMGEDTTQNPLSQLYQNFDQGFDTTDLVIAGELLSASPA